MRDQGSTFREVGFFPKFTSQYLRHYKPYRNEIFTNMFFMHFWTEGRVVLISWSNISDVEHPGREQRHPSKENRQRANWLKGPDCHRNREEALITGLPEQLTTYLVSGPQQTNKNTNFATICMYGVGQGQWAWMTFERSRCNAKGQIWSWST